MLARWRLMNRSLRTDLDGFSAPSATDEYLYYQTLVGIWPENPPDDPEREKLRERLEAFMLKAVREAKVHTSWINPDSHYEEALRRFVSESLRSELFLKDVNQSIPRVARVGLLVGLSQAVLKVASPGVPDYYQGTELWDFSLVDPDNRRPVDYELRKAFIKKSSTPEDLLKNLSSGEAKLHIIRKGLALRRKMPEVFSQPSYTPLLADDGKEENVCAFALRKGNQVVIAVAPRLFAGLLGDAHAPVGEEVWGDSRLVLPEGAFENVLTGEKHSGGSVRVADLLSTFPVALLATMGR